MNKTINYIFRKLHREKFCFFQEIQNLIDNYEKAKANLSTIEAKRTAGMDKLKDDKSRIANTIKDIRGNLNVQLDRLERESLRELDIKCKRLEDKLQNEIENIREIANNWDNNMKHVMEVGRKSDINALKKILENGSTLKRKGDELMEKARKNTDTEKLDFIPSQEIITGKFDLKALGYFVDDKIHEYNTFLQDEYDISIETDDSDTECDITGCCVMPDGTVILADNSNANLKKLNETYKVVASCNLPEPPCDLCPTADNEVAVSLPRKKTVLFVTAGEELQLNNSLYVGYGCMCVDFDMNLQRLFVTYDWPEQIRVFKRDGEFLHAIWGTEKDTFETAERETKDQKPDNTKANTTSGSSKSKLFCIPFKSKKSKKVKQPIFSSLEDIMFSSSDGRLYSCDLEKGLIVLTDDGQVISTVRNFREMPEFTPKRICKGCNNDFFLYGQSEKTTEFGILHIGKDKTVEKIKGDVEMMDDIDEIEAMCFNSNTNQLILTTKADNFIKVFNVL